MVDLGASDPDEHFQQRSLQLAGHRASRKRGGRQLRKRRSEAGWLYPSNVSWEERSAMLSAGTAASIQPVCGASLSLCRYVQQSGTRSLCLPRDLFIDLRHETDDTESRQCHIARLFVIARPTPAFSGFHGASSPSRSELSRDMLSGL
jgi:hypothetical protein